MLLKSAQKLDYAVGRKRRKAIYHIKPEKLNQTRLTGTTRSNRQLADRPKFSI